MTTKMATGEAVSLSTPIGLALVVVAAALVLIAPVWLVDIVPTQDGPIHLAQADMIARFGWGGTLSGPVGTFYEWNTRVEPNYSVYAILAALIRITGDPLAAQTIYLSLYGIFYVVAAYWAVAAETDRPLLPFLLLLPVAFGAFIHLGFFNYALGFPAFLAFAALWRRIGGERSVATFAMLALALFALGLTHLATLVAACLLLAAGGLARALAATDGTPKRSVVKGLMADGLWYGAAALPALALIVAFLIAYPSATTDAANLRYSILSVIRRLVSLDYLFSYTWWEVAALAPLIAATIYGALAALKRWRSGDLVWPIFVLLVVLVSLLDLRTAQGVALAERLAPYSWIGVALAIAARQPGLRAAQVLGVVAALAIVAQSGIRAVAYLGWADTARAVLRAGASYPGQSFAGADLTATASSNYSWRVHPGIHIHQLAAIRSHGVGIGSSLPSMRFYGYYPLRYVRGEDFLFALPEWEEKPGRIALADFRAAHQGAPKVLIILGSGENGASLARFHRHQNCTTSEGTRRSVLVCADLAHEPARGRAPIGEAPGGR